MKMKLVDLKVGSGMGDKLRMSVLKMMKKIENWNEELELMMEEKRVSNPIVGRVLEHTTRSMGLTAPSTKRTDTLETVDSLRLAIPTTTTDNSRNYGDDIVTSLLTNDE